MKTRKNSQSMGPKSLHWKEVNLLFMEIEDKSHYVFYQTFKYIQPLNHGGKHFCC